MENVISVSNMRTSDAHTIERHVSGRELMLKAARGVYNAVKWKNKRVAVFCGGGNNGGDGYALAMLLAQDGISCSVFRVSEHFSEDGLYYCNQAQKAGIFTEIFDEQTELSEYDILVDCIFGTGFHGEIKGIAKKAIRAINAAQKYVVSVDINSGLNGDSGVASLAVQSDLTVSIGYYKTGMFLNDAPNYIKKLINADIGIHLEEQQYHLIAKEQVSHFMGYGSLTLTSAEFCEKFQIDRKKTDFVRAMISVSCKTKQIIVVKTKKSLAIADQTYVYFQADYAKCKA